MKDKDRLHEELNEHAPFLNKLRENGSGMQAPERYFEELETEVYRQLEAIGAKRKPVQPLPRPSLWQQLENLWQPRMALAFAGVAALTLAAWWYFQTPATSLSDQALAAELITPEDAASYLMANLGELEPQQIAMALPSEELPPIMLEHTDPGAESGQPTKPLELRPEDLDDLLQDLTDEELKELMLDI